MSAVPVGSREQQDRVDAVTDQTVGGDGSEETTVAGTPVVVRRSASVAALVGYAASVVAIAYLWRASQTMTVLDWGLCAVMAVVAAAYLTSLVDARTPLLVADDLGVRIRLGNEWRGLPWEAIGHVVVHPRRGLLRDGRLVFAPRNLARALEGLDVKARRHVALNQKMYGAPLAVPLGSTTRVEGATGSTSGGSAPAGLAEDIAALARGRAEVVVLDPDTLEVVDDQADTARVGRSREEKRAARDGSAGERADRPQERQSAGRDGAAEAPEDRREAVEEAPDQAGVGHRQIVFPADGVEIAWKPSAVPPVADAGEEDMAAGVATEPFLEGAEPAGSRARRSILGGIGRIVSRVGKGRDGDADAGPVEPGAGPEPEATRPVHETALAREAEEPESPATSEPHHVSGSEAVESAEETGEGPAGARSPSSGQAKPPFATAALRRTRPGLRAEARLDPPATVGNTALDPSDSRDAHRSGLPEGHELRRPGDADGALDRLEVEDRVRPISTLGDPVEPLVIDDYVTEPAYDPVIGPELAAARTRLGLSVDDLAERTRIRPHVIESIEVDDFAPCGGDFYARGHLRTLARILGLKVEPLLEKFEERYATAPINARRVFEAELATGMTGSMRSTMGGPSWGLLIGVVLVLVLVWGVLRLFTTEPSDVNPPVIHGAAALLTPYTTPSSGTP